jgi:hypothetical protein
VFNKKGCLKNFQNSLIALKSIIYGNLYYAFLLFFEKTDTEYLHFIAEPELD